MSAGRGRPRRRGRALQRPTRAGGRIASRSPVTTAAPPGRPCSTAAGLRPDRELKPGLTAFHALVSLVMTDKPYGVGRPEARPDAESLVRWTGALRVVRTRRAPVAAGTTG